MVSLDRCSGERPLQGGASELRDLNDEKHTREWVSVPQNSRLDVLGQEGGRSVYATHSEQREAGKWESRVYLKFNGRGAEDVQLCWCGNSEGGWGMI